MKKCSCQDSNSRLLIESTVSNQLDDQDNDAKKNEAIALYVYNCIIIIYCIE